MAYTNAVFYLDLESGSDAARTALTVVTVSNPSGTITRCNKTAHGLATGAVVDLTLFSAWLNDAWKITVVDANNFDLDAAVWQTTADNSGTATPRGGSSKADAWLTIASGASAARIQPGDTIRIKASTDETLVGNATWTKNSRTVTLAGAVTANVTDCEAAWTASANVTATASTTIFREGTHSANLGIASAFTTGKVAFFATGALDLSAYQQVSFMIRSSISLGSGVFTLTLCSDTIGATAVHTIAIPALGAQVWVPVVFDNAGALSASIQSVALNALSDPGLPSINIDNIIACKSSASADALTHRSLIGKIHNKSWVASTAYSLNDKRRPTQGNRNGFQYKVTTAGTTSSGEPTWPVEVGKTVTDGSVVWTCEELEDTWYPIASINGTAVNLAGDPTANSATSSTMAGYPGATETVSTYKRETIQVLANQVTSGGTSANNAIADAGTAGSPIIFSGGWDRTNMTAQSGETWYDGATAFGGGIQANAKDYVTLRNFGLVRFFNAFLLTGAASKNVRWENCHALANQFGLNALAASRLEMVNVIASMNQVGSTGFNTISWRGQCVQVNGTASAGAVLGFGPAYTEVNYLWCKSNLNTGVGLVGGSATSGVFARIKNFTSENNLAAIVPANVGGFDFVNPNFIETLATAVTAPTTGYDGVITITRSQQTAGDHRRITDGGTIVSATDQRHTASGISWKFLPTSTTRGETYPLRLAVAQIQLASGVAKTVSIWTRRDNTNIKGRLIVRGGYVPGVAEQYVDCNPSINTWTQSSSLTLTATEDGIVEVEFLVWDGVGTTNAYWIDDLVVS